MSEGKDKQDFIQCLGRDMSIDVFNHLNLNDPRDLIRASAVSKSWYQFVVKNGLCKKRCFKLLPEITDIVDSIEVDNIIEPVSDMVGVCADWECLKRNHKVYAALAFHLARYVKNGITSKIEASYSLNELGDVLESLTYKLCSTICLITKIRVQPYQAYCEDDSPMYTYSTVRFRIGRVKAPTAWTYTSPHYSILQENPWQELKLPEPALCNGGVLLVELLGRVKKKGSTFEIGISQVQIEGLPTSAAFDVKINHGSGKYTLKYNHITYNLITSATSRISSCISSASSRMPSFTDTLLIVLFVSLAVIVFTASFRFADRIMKM